MKIQNWTRIILYFYEDTTTTIFKEYYIGYFDEQISKT